MVWGMGLPDDFGKFWPDGEFEGGGWGHRLDSFCQTQPFEVQRALFDHGPSAHIADYSYYVSQKFINEVGTKVRAEDVPFTPVLPQEAPASFVTEKTYKELGSLIKLNNRILAVDDALKALIETLEPDVHQFFPIEITMPKGSVYPKSFYTLVIGQYFDSFVPEKSEKGSFKPDGPDYYFHTETKKGLNGIALSQAVFGKAHLWRERRLSGEWLTCFSDELNSEIEKADLRIPKLHKMMEA
jgi:hypothetical protein